jgi:hypothetical protein
MKMKILAAAIAAVSLPVLAQTSTPVEPRQARVEVSDPSGATAAAPKKASKSTKAAKSTKTAKKTSKKKAPKKPQTAG